MIDRQTWAGAILAVTVVVAGAGSLPALLLRPIATDPPPAALAPAAKVAEPVSTGQETQTRRPSRAAAPAVAVAEPAKPTPPPTPQPVAFPPVQPVGITTIGAARRNAAAGYGPRASGGPRTGEDHASHSQADGRQAEAKARASRALSDARILRLAPLNGTRRTALGPRARVA